MQMEQMTVADRLRLTIRVSHVLGEIGITHVVPPARVHYVNNLIQIAFDSVAKKCFKLPTKVFFMNESNVLNKKRISNSSDSFLVH